MTDQEHNARPLAWEFQDRRNEWRATYRGLEVRAVNDQGAENPFEAWEGEPPTLVYAGRRDGFSDYSGGAVAAPLAAMTNAAISRHWRALAKALDLKEAEHDSEARDMAEGCGLADARRDLFESALDDAASGNGSDYLETLAAVWRVAGVVCETWASNGYSQSDWAEGLSVATPAWAFKVGAPRDSHAAQCKAAGRLWGAWAWGDVYGYIIDDGDDEDSCFGFYGSDFTESGLDEAARSAVDSILDGRRRRRQARAADLIKARVPLYLRPGLLDATAPAA